jgi:hypothetical protein
MIVWHLGLPSAGAGMASSDLVKAKIASLGMALLQPAAGLAALERLLATPSLAASPRQLAASPAVIDVVPFRWQRLLARYQQQQLPELFAAMVDWIGFQQQARLPVAVARQRTVAAARPAVADAAAAAAARQQLLEAVKAAVSGVIGREVRDRRCVQALAARVCAVGSENELAIIYFKQAQAQNGRSQRVGSLSPLSSLNIEGFSPETLFHRQPVMSLWSKPLIQSTHALPEQPQMHIAPHHCQFCTILPHRSLPHPSAPGVSRCLLMSR